ncbi:glutamate formiminotransferase/formiminotetrahydrofolate cyclodeaminase [Ancylomarina subtilis]|uniref:Formimidoyltransferase-cyclodeaminase n=1 Tax=Ancylomarina subtilis TaxID=1639035 RepID=A0A4V2FT37_9BACT|nr:glutamate formimidoyltransferase [Ancylomarina subtilis]RZT96595.1 glutamate formiminotransferase/formiminotetrahydrofolate cyclodeaminase [Ancylomarina subtilis]
MKQLIECVPNFSEGNDMNIIKQITNEIESVEGVSLVDVDPGKATNRTVVTMVGTPDEVLEAAVKAVKKAAELIDMSKHSGAHPRFGATDVCPLVPVANITMEETVKLAHKLAERIGTELGIPVYCYENAARIEERKNLATCRAGEYEAVKDRIGTERWKPDFGPAEFTEAVAKSGVTAVSARNFLVAYNFNLNTTSTRRANAIAFDVRERGRTKREGNPSTGKIVKDENGNPVMIPGTLKATKAIGWFIEEFGVAQISMNMTDISITSIHQAFDEVCAKAQARGIRVTGSELVGVVPLKAMLDAGKHYLRMQGRSTGIADREIIKIAVKSLGLDELYPFDPDKKIIEYILENEAKKGAKKLVDMSLTAFVEETASESMAPGGGSISAYMGAMGAALGSMVANLSAHKPGWDDRWEEFSDWAEKGKEYHTKLNWLVDEDTNAFNKIMDAVRMPKKTEEEKAARAEAMEEATKFATMVPFQTMELCLGSMDVAKAMAEIGNPNSVTDAGVGALAARSGVIGAFMNVKINAADLTDKAWAADIIAKGQAIVDKAQALENEIVAMVNAKI